MKGDNITYEDLLVWEEWFNALSPKNPSGKEEEVVIGTMMCNLSDVPVRYAVGKVEDEKKD